MKNVKKLLIAAGYVSSDGIIYNKIEPPTMHHVLFFDAEIRYSIDMDMPLLKISNQVPEIKIADVLVGIGAISENQLTQIENDATVYDRSSRMDPSLRKHLFTRKDNAHL